jgi:hypothetical protein
MSFKLPSGVGTRYNMALGLIQIMLKIQFQNIPSLH